MSPVTNSYFSGAGLMDIGLRDGGLAIAQSFEIDSKACATQRANFSHEVIECDISRKTAWADDQCDVMVATYPCTRYSTIADIHSTRTGDELFLHFFRHIALREPEVYVVENVPGMRKFPVVMEAMTQLPDYYVSVFCPISAQNWLPQRRDRLIIMGSRKPFNWREPAIESHPVTLKEIIEPDVEMTIESCVTNRLAGKYRDFPIISDPDKGDIAPTCVAHYAKDRSTRLVADRRYPYGARPYTVREFARLMGVPDNFNFAGSDNDAYRQIGNGVAVPVGRWVADEVMSYFN